MDTILNLIPGRKQKATDEPNEDAIKRTHDYLRLSLCLHVTHTVNSPCIAMFTDASPNKAVHLQMS